MILVAVTNRASYPRCKTLIEALGDEGRVLLMNPEPEIAQELAGKVVITTTSRIWGGHQAMAATAGHFMADAALALGSLKPKAVVVIADRHEVLSVALSARIMNIPVVHLLAGERSGSVDDDIRFAISALSDLLLAPHVHARDELLRRGYMADDIEVTGCPSIDLCTSGLGGIGGIGDIVNYGHGEALHLDKPYYLVCQHPDTNDSVEQNIEQLVNIALRVVPHGAQVVWIRPSQHDACGREMDKHLSQIANPGWRLIRHIPHMLMLSLLNNCIAMIGNSSIMYREAAYLGVPCVPVGARQRGRHPTSNARYSAAPCFSTNLQVSATPSAQGRHLRDSLWSTGGGRRAADILLERYSDGE